MGKKNEEKLQIYEKSCDNRANKKSEGENKEYPGHPILKMLQEKGFGCGSNIVWENQQGPRKESWYAMMRCYGFGWRKWLLLITDQKREILKKIGDIRRTKKVLPTLTVAVPPRATVRIRQ